MNNRLRTESLFVVLAITLAGCDGSRATGPTAPSPARQPIPQPTPQPTSQSIQLAGTVSDAAWSPLAGARVEVVNGPQAGLSTTADARGEFRLTGTFDATTQFRATKEGHVAATWPLPSVCAGCRPNWWIHFYLEASATRPNIAGDYTLTFVASSTCANLPDYVRVRAYEATVAPSSDPTNSRFDVTVKGSELLEQYKSFTIGLAGDYLKSDVGEWGHGGAGLVEQIAPNTYLTLGGEVTASVTDASTISASFYGFFDRCELTTKWGSRHSCGTGGGVVTQAQCGPTKHQLTLTRR